MEERADCCDNEVDLHLAYYLERLPQILGLERIDALNLDDPQKTLAVLKEMLQVVAEEQKKARMLLRLKARAHELKQQREGAEIIDFQRTNRDLVAL